jgi:hypothetical protein
MQATLAAVCLLSSIAAWLAGATFWWVVAGVLQVSVIPFTLIVILPTNKQLLNLPWTGGQHRPVSYSHAGAGCTP